MGDASWHAQWEEELRISTARVFARVFEVQESKRMLCLWCAQQRGFHVSELETSSMRGKILHGFEGRVCVEFDFNQMVTETLNILKEWHGQYFQNTTVVILWRMVHDRSRRKIWVSWVSVKMDCSECKFLREIFHEFSLVISLFPFQSIQT